jgi:hypothetical protein
VRNPEFACSGSTFLEEGRQAYIDMSLYMTRAPIAQQAAIFQVFDSKLEKSSSSKRSHAKAEPLRLLYYRMGQERVRLMLYLANSSIVAADITSHHQ